MIASSAATIWVLFSSKVKVGFKSMKSRSKTSTDDSIAGMDKALTKKWIDEKKERFGYTKLEMPLKNKYFGMGKVFNGYLQRVLPTFSPDVLNPGPNLDETDKNLFLYGKPGTGKTFFIKKLACLCALNLKAKEILKKNNLPEFHVGPEMAKDEKLLNELYDAEESLELYCVSPATFLEGIVGESEAKTLEFMNYIDYRQKKVPIFVFVDEADSLFPNRGGGGGLGLNQVTTSLLNLWLAWLGGMRDAGGSEKTQRRVIYAFATNYRTSIDGAMYRRAKNMIGLSKPSFEEIRNYIVEKGLHNINATLSTAEIDKLAQSLQGLALSSVSSLVTSLEEIVRQQDQLLDYAVVLQLFSEEARKETEVERKKEEEKRKNMFTRDTPNMSDPEEHEYAKIYDGFVRNRRILLISKEEMEELDMFALSGKHKADEDNEKVADILKHLKKSRNAERTIKSHTDSDSEDVEDVEKSAEEKEDVNYLNPPIAGSMSYAQKQQRIERLRQERKRRQEETEEVEKLAKNDKKLSIWARLFGLLRQD